MADKIAVSFDFPGVEEGERAVRMLDSMQLALKAGAGAGKSLEELRKILVGLKGKGSALDELNSSIRGLNEAATSLKSGFTTSIGGLSKVIKNEFTQLKAQLNTLAPDFETAGKRAGNALGSGLQTSLAGAEVTMQKQFRSISAKARAEATKMYESMVAGQPNAKIKDVGALFQLQEAGASLSPYHKSILDNWKRSSAETMRALRVQMATESKEIGAAAALAARSIQAEVRAATIGAGGDYSSLSSGRLMRIKNAELLMNMPSKAEFEFAAAKALAEAKATKARLSANIGNTGVRLGGAEVTGAYSPYNAMTAMSTVKAPPKVKLTPKPAEVDALSKAFQGLAVSGNNVHSMARGLASGFDLLWLTWGNLAPLFIGAAISNGFMQTAKTGMELAHTMEVIAQLGGNTKEEMAGLATELDRMGRSGPFGPLEIADAMKTLSLAGLKANEILGVTQDVLNFSIAGTTDLKTSADTLVAVSTAFGMGASGFGRVADVISKAAAESMSSVESFAGAMKTASVINAQYGVSLEDTATGIAALSQLGIQGTSAGTALRNMYADLSGRSEKVAKVLKSQGIEMRTTTGEFRPMLEVVADLNTKLQSLDGISQKNLLQSLLSERGAKGIVELLRLINSEAKDMGKGLPNALTELQATITSSYGFAAIKAAQLSQTAESQFKGVKANLQTSMAEAYSAMEPVLLLIADSLKKTFSSPEFVASLTNMVTLVSQLALSLVNLTTFLVEHSTAVGVLLGLYVAYRATMVLITLAKTAYTAATITSTAATAADTTATLANNAAKTGAVAALAGLARFLPGVGTAITVAATAWMAYDFWQTRAKDSTKEANDLYNNNVIKSLQDEASKLRRLNDLRAEGLSLSAAQQVIDDEKRRGAATKPAQDNVTKAIREEYQELVKLNKLKEEQVNYTTREGAARIRSQTAVLQAAKARTNQAKLEESETIRRTDDAVRAVQVERKREADRLAEEAKARAAQMKQGLGMFELSGAAGGKFAGITADKTEKADIKNQVKKLEVEAEKQVQVERNKEKELEALRNVGFVGDNEYYAKKYATAQAVVKIEEDSLKEMIDARKKATFIGPDAAANRLDNATQLLELEKKLGKATADNAILLRGLDIQREESARKTVQAYLDADRAAQAYLNTLKRDGDREAAGYGIGNEARNQMGVTGKIGDNLQDELKKLNDKQNDRIRDGKDTPEATEKYTRDVTRAQQTAEAQLAIERDKYAKKKALEADWQKGVSEGVNNYMSETQNVYKQMENLTTKTLKGMEDGLVNFVMTGKLSFSDLARSILEDLARMMIKQAMFNAMASMKSSSGGGFFGSILGALAGGGAAGGAAGAAGGAAVSAPTMVAAKGGAFDNAPGLSAYSGSVVNKPTVFPFARGAGLMGEAGPEAILPLTRGAGGKLGVQASGGSGVGDIYVTVDASGSSSKSDDTNEQGKQLGNMIGAAVRGVLVQEMRPGGMLA